MPRKPTSIGTTRRWIRDNAHWLTKDHAPLIQQLKMLAETQDRELDTEGKVRSATASQYRLTFTSLMSLRSVDGDAEPEPEPTPVGADDDDDDLFEPLS